MPLNSPEKSEKQPCLLIACLGNRNISVDGKNIPTEHFRDETEKLAGAIAENLHRVTLNILPDALALAGQELHVEKVLLFATDQKNPERNFQDTVFEAAIVKALLHRDYPGIREIHTEILSGDPSSTPSMFQTFRFLLPRYLQEAEGAVVLYCQSGGTSQQKNALGLLLDYQLDPEQYKLAEVKYDNRKKVSEAVWTDPDYLREITALNQMEALIETGNYGGAASLMPRKGNLKNYRTVLEWAQAMSEFQLTASCVQSPNFSEAIKQWFPFPGQWKDGSLFPAPEEAVSAQLVQRFVSGIQLKFSIAQHYYLKQDCIGWLSWYYRFMESVLANILEQKAGIPFASGDAARFEDIQQLLSERAIREGSCYRLFFCSGESAQKVYSGIPTQILVAQDYSQGPISELLDSFRSTNSVLRNRNNETEPRAQEGIDILRNSLMHRGEGFDWQKVGRVFPQHSAIMEKTAILFNLDPDQNVFRRINQTILDKSRGK